MLRFKTKHVGEVNLVKFSGEIDYSNFRSMKELLSSMLKDGKTKLIVDLDDIDFLDSSGLSLFISLSKEARKRGGAIKLVKVKDQILQMLKITHLVEIFDLYRTEEDAILSFGIG